MHTIHHALVLNLHQPAGNLDELLTYQPWETREVLEAMDRIPRSLWGYEDVGRVHLSLSGTLLETLSNLDFQSRMYGVVDCGSLLWFFQNLSIFRILGTGYYHPVLPLIPEADREEQIRRWQGIGRHLFGRDQFQGFWPPEMGFSMELIPLLRRAGYRYVLVDSEHVEAVTPMTWQELRYRPHVARYGDDEIIVVVRDRDLSNAQESGMDLDWFTRETAARTQGCDFEPLVTTATDGDNGGWFRNWQPQSNFWGFYRNLMDYTRSGGPIRPTFIDDYLDRYGVSGEVRVNTGAWNTGWHHGRDFLQWTGSQAQKDALVRVEALSNSVQEIHKQAHAAQEPEARDLLEQAHWRLLHAQTSCHFFWGEAWLPRAHEQMDASLAHLEQARLALKSRPAGYALRTLRS